MVMGEAEGWSPIRLSRRTLNSGSRDQNSQAANNASAEAPKKRTIWLVKRGRDTGTYPQARIESFFYHRYQYKSQRQRGDDDGGEPGGYVVEPSVNVAAHQLAIVHQTQDRE